MPPFLFLWLYFLACGILVPRPGMDPGPPAAEAWSLNHLDCQGILTFFFFFFLTSVLPVLASFPGPPSLQATDFRLRRKRVSFLIASEKVQGQQPIGSSLDEPIWALYPPQKLEGIGREWAEIGRMVPQRKVAMQLLEGYSKIHR